MDHTTTQEFNFETMRANMKISAFVNSINNADIIHIATGEIKSIICDVNEITYNTIKITFKNTCRRGAIFHNTCPKIIAIMITVEEIIDEDVKKYQLVYRFEEPTEARFENDELLFN